MGYGLVAAPTPQPHPWPFPSQVTSVFSVAAGFQVGESTGSLTRWAPQGWVLVMQAPAGCPGPDCWLGVAASGLPQGGLGISGSHIAGP